jgi:hypothetical protein
MVTAAYPIKSFAILTKLTGGKGSPRKPPCLFEVSSLLSQPDAERSTAKYLDEGFNVRFGLGEPTMMDAE